MPKNVMEKRIVTKKTLFAAVNIVDIFCVNFSKTKRHNRLLVGAA